MVYTDILIDWKGYKLGVNQRCPRCRVGMPNFIIHGCGVGYTYWEYCEGITILNELIELPEYRIPGNHPLDGMLWDMENRYSFEVRFRIRKFRGDEFEII